MVRPGPKSSPKGGGIQKWSGWRGPVLTDSGGFQLFSLSELAKITDEGVHFRSHVDGSQLFMSPEESIRVQNEIGSDIMMPLDDCVGFPGGALQGGKIRHEDASMGQAVQGGQPPGRPGAFRDRPGGDIRRLEARERRGLVALDFDGYSIGGVSVGEGTVLMREAVEAAVPFLPTGKPRYLMGVGLPMDILDAVHAGVDMFDCVIPTRNGRNGWAFTSRGMVKLRNSRYAQIMARLKRGVTVTRARNFTRSYSEAPVLRERNTWNDARVAA